MFCPWYGTNFQESYSRVLENDYLATVHSWQKQRKKKKDKFLSNVFEPAIPR